MGIGGEEREEGTRGAWRRSYPFFPQWNEVLKDRVTREERCSFPVGTDRPARRRPAALDRPVTPVPFCRAGWPNVIRRLRPEHSSIEGSLF